MKKLAALLALAVALSAPASAATKTVTLSVPSMTCATCPITVKMALSRVEGVIEAKVTWEPREAVVTYDDALEIRLLRARRSISRSPRTGTL